MNSYLFLLSFLHLASAQTRQVGFFELVERSHYMYTIYCRDGNHQKPQNKKSSQFPKM